MTVRRTILVADKSAIERALIQRQLELAGVAMRTFLEAACAQRVFAVAAKEYIDVMIINARLLNLRAPQVVTSLRNCALDCGYIIITMDPGEPPDLAALYQLGVKAHLTKPFSTHELKAVLEGIMR